MPLAVRSSLVRARLARPVARVLDGTQGPDAVVAAAGRGPRARRAVLTELRRRVLAEPALEALRRAEPVLHQVGGGEAVLRELRTAVADAHPRLAYPLAEHLRGLLDTDRTIVTAEILERLKARDDFTGTSLDPVIEGVLLPVKREIVLAMMPWLRDHAAHQGDIDVARLLAVVEHLTDESLDPLDVLVGVQDDADALLLLRIAIAVHSAEVVQSLLRSRGADGLRPRQLSRAAALLWRLGDVELAVDCAQQLVDDTGNIGKRARLIVAERDSFAMMDTDWRPPAAAPRSATATPRKVVHAIQNSLPHRVTGSANRTHGLLSGLVRHGYEIDALTPPGFPLNDVTSGARAELAAQHEIDGVRYHHLLEHDEAMPVYPLQDYITSYSSSLRDLAERRGASLIHSASNAYNALAASVAARSLGLPHIYEVRGLNEEGRRSLIPEYEFTPQYRFAKHIETLAAQEADHVIAITEGLRDTLVERGIPADKIEVVPNGVDTSRFSPLERDPDLEARYGLEGKTVIGYIGSLNWYEGLPLLLEAVSRIRDDHPDLRVMIVGGGSEASRLEEARSELGLEDIVLLLGKIPFDQVEAHYSLVDIAPITRLSSPVTEIVSPLKPFEALAMGKPLVTSDVAVLKEFVNGTNGLLFRKDDVESLAEVLDRVAGDAALRASLAEEGRRWVIANRDWDVLSGRVTALYERLGAS
ncbi:glycosyltransferase family 4 protein [Aeromicrobium sp. 50.2.37]|uniref:glycosyltransferase family 4 protein n=1 Tax=Aeromicrobium sp. 50.2.37 TaxID=2969305 RepID=UPI00214FCE52|nr:glycosyltransferase family 4 protein [Aeromicrobium sp. 50.2.37]MCR4513383.1 glycosyltransferase family 4 protein [Aeromicrobium sp. 50.2.37]